MAVAKGGARRRRKNRPDVELELKLTGQPKALRSLFTKGVGQRQTAARPTTKQLESVYYDTPDRQLRARGLALRVRRDVEQFVQTLKVGDDAAAVVLDRGEWETALASPEPDLDALPKKATRSVGQLPCATLAPVFTTKVQRQIRRIETTDRTGRSHLVEVAIDLGKITSGEQAEPIAEVELELLEGDPSALYDVALELDRRASLHIEPRSKSARGYALASGRPPPWHRSSDLHLDPKASVDEALAAIFGSCFDQWIANEAAAFDGRDPEGVHQMRIGLRRLRSALSIFGKLLPAGQLDWLKTEARQIIGSLGPARDWDVFLSELLAPVLAAQPEDPDLLALRAAAERMQTESYDAARTAIRSPDYTHFVLQLGQWITNRVWQEHDDDAVTALHEQRIGDFADHLLANRHRRALKLGRDFATLTTEQRHQVRIAIKKLRYAAEFFNSLYRPKRTKPYVRAQKELQDSLGHLNDVAVAKDLLRDLLARTGDQAEGRGLVHAAGMVLGWHARGVADLEPAMQARWTAFTAQKPFWG